MGTNRYAYSFNDPVNKLDLSGHEAYGPGESPDAATRDYEAAVANGDAGIQSQIDGNNREAAQREKDFINSGSWWGGIYGQRTGSLSASLKPSLDVEWTGGISARNRSVLVAEDGVIIAVGWENPKNHGQGFGFRVKEEIDDGSVFTYAHLDPDSVSVRVGDRVKAGDHLGNYDAAKNGTSTGPHLHLEYRSANQAVLDPKPYAATVMPGYTLREDLGFRSRHPVTGASRPHNGIDLVGPWVSE